MGTGLAAAALLLIAMQHPAEVLRPPDALRVAHSHNDYEQTEPLSAALRAGFPSVEADVWWRRGEVVVSHSPLGDRGRLEDLYLRPLQERVAALGSVHADGRPFYLWIELKESSRELTDALHGMLARYPMLTAFADDGVAPGPVTVVLTGDDGAKRRYVDEHPLRYACRDSHNFDFADGPADHRWSWYALPWSRLLDARRAAVSLRRALEPMRRIVEHAHHLGRRVRLYAMPEREEAWAAAVEAGVDLIGTDDIEALRSFLVTRSGGPERVGGATTPSLPLASLAFSTSGMQILPEDAKPGGAAR